MPETLTSPLLEAATETFESLAYLFAEPGITDDIPGEDVEGVVAVAFSGPSHGGVIMQLSGGVLPALAANMLGLDDPTSGHDQRDALGEAANVICGNVLPRVAGSAAVFALGSPTAVRQLVRRRPIPRRRVGADPARCRRRTRRYRTRDAPVALRGAPRRAPPHSSLRCPRCPPLPCRSASSWSMTPPSCARR
ncbi:MAG: chemotaxis protein CheX [Gemmatimonadetes bacterium]|nr:chemotaxis protein CheX [Gemmatimonadota bacterium]